MHVAYSMAGVFNGISVTLKVISGSGRFNEEGLFKTPGIIEVIKKNAVASVENTFMEGGYEGFEL